MVVEGRPGSWAEQGSLASPPAFYRGPAVIPSFIRPARSGEPATR
jgi:hypothetical protein